MGLLKRLNFPPANPKWNRVAWYVGIAALWCFIWFAPWQMFLHELPWLKLGIALIVFMVPGISIYGLLADRNAHWINHITFGFVISHLLFAVMALAGRLAHSSFDLIRNLMMTLGMLFLLMYAMSGNAHGFFPRMDRTAFRQAASVWTLGLVSVLVGLIVIQRVLSDDDLSYLAFLTNTQYSTQMGFNDIFFGLAEPVSTRFWLMSAPFAQAFLADLGNLPGLLILGGYYEPFLVVIAVLCWYGLARTLRLSRQAAALSVVFQILFLLLLSEYLHPGAPFFRQLSADKATATFILAPVFLQSVFLLLKDMTGRHFLVCLLAGMSLTFMHPIALAYAIFIGGMLIMLTANRDNIRARGASLLVMLASVLPQVILRFAGTRVEENVPYGLDATLNQGGIENMVAQWGDSRFYGFNPHILEMTFPYGSNFPFLEPLLKWGWLSIPVLAVGFAIRDLRKSDSANYVFAAFLLCTLAGIPFTGWIIGYFLSAWALERTTWLFPFGLSVVFLLQSLRDGTKTGLALKEWVRRLEIKTRILNLPLILSVIFTSGILLLYMREQGLPDLSRFETKSRRYVDIAAVGQYLDQHIPEQAVVIGSEDLNDLIPGVSSKAKLVTFRTSDFFSMALFPVKEIEQRISDRRALFSATTPPEIKLQLLEKYNVEYLALQGGDRDLFSNIISEYPDLLTVEKVGRFFVIEIHDE